MTLSRLEAREILHHLKPSCDPDVIQKLSDIAQQPVAIHHAEPTGESGVFTPPWLNTRPLLPPNAPPDHHEAVEAGRATASQQRPVEGALPTDDESWKAVLLPWHSNIDPKTGKPYFTQADIDIINQERAVSLTAAHQAAKQPAYTKLIPPQMSGPGILRIPLGVRNANNDMCCALRDPATGARYETNEQIPEGTDRNTLISIFRCGKNEEHGAYAFENTSVLGCSRCFMGGGDGTGRRSSGGDGTHSEREEQF